MAFLAESLKRASSAHFGAPVAFMGEGGSIPFMAMLGKRYPKTQFVVTGVLGPHSNAHGPNEFLDIPTAKKVSACIADSGTGKYGAPCCWENTASRCVSRWRAKIWIRLPAR